MAHFQLGHADQVYKLLEQLRQLIQTDDEWKANGVSRRFMEEALQVISRSPVHAERPVKEARMLEPAVQTMAPDGRFANHQRQASIAIGWFGRPHECIGRKA